MAGRKDKKTVDYFPHYCTSGKTMFIIESKFGHLGYSIWFKTLEILGQSENHYIDLRDDTDKLFLISKLKITELEFTEIYNLLSELGAIDKYFWSKKIIFSENFIKNIEDAYVRRKIDVVDKCNLCIQLFNKCTHKCDKSKQDYTEESKVNKNKEEYTFDEFWEDYDKKVGSKKDCEKKFNKLSDSVKLKIKETLPAFKKSIREKQYQPYPSSYLNQERWNDEIKKENNAFKNLLT